MAYVRRRPGTSGPAWQVRWRGPDGEQRGPTFARKAEADRFAASVETDMDRGTYTDPARGRLTVGAWTQTWLASKVDLRPTSLVRLEGIVATHLVPAFGTVPLARLGHADVRAWVAHLGASGLSPSTVRKAYAALSQAMSAAVADRRLAANPCLAVPLPTETVHEQRFLSVAELDRLVEATAPRYRAMVLLAALGGLRFGELAGLRRLRVSAVPAAVEVVETLVEANGVHHRGPPKTRRSRRTVPLAGEVRDALAAHLDAWTDPSPAALVFTNTNGDPLRRGVFRRWWWAPATEAAVLGGAPVPRPAPHLRRLLGRRREGPEMGLGAGGPLLGRLHPRPLRPPVRGPWRRGRGPRRPPGGRPGPLRLGERATYLDASTGGGSGGGAPESTP
jgi:integrase